MSVHFNIVVINFKVIGYNSFAYIITYDFIVS